MGLVGGSGRIEAIGATFSFYQIEATLDRQQRIGGSNKLVRWLVACCDVPTNIYTDTHMHRNSVQMTARIRMKCYLQALPASGLTIYRVTNQAKPQQLLLLLLVAQGPSATDCVDL